MRNSSMHSISQIKAYDNSFSISSEDEIKYAKKALTYHGLYVGDQFWKTIEKDQIIVIYGLKGTQLYRNFNFFKNCIYSLSELSTIEWEKLFEMPDTIKKQCLALFRQVTQNYFEVLPIEIPKFIVRQDNVNAPAELRITRTTICHLKSVGTVISTLEKDSSSKTPEGLILTYTSEFLADGDEAKNLDLNK